MTININGNPLWKKEKRYKCGCNVINGISFCPIHDEPILEQQMIYGNKTTQDYINEKEEYEKHNLNE